MPLAMLLPFLRRVPARSTIVAAVIACLALSSCDSLGFRVRSPITKVEKERRFGPGKLTAEAIQSEVMSFADTFNATIAEEWNQLAARAREDGAAGTLDAEQLARVRRSALQNKIASVSAALSIASSPNPTVALADMITMITLEHAVLESPRSVELYGAEASARLAAVYESQRERVQRIAEQAMTPKQRDELTALIAEWRAENPETRYVANVRLEDFARARQQTFVANGRSNDSLLALVALDPLAGLDPAQREVQRSRMLGERVFYFTSRWPQVLKWQAESLYQGLLGAPEIQQALDAARTGTDAIARVSDVAERLRDDIAAERSAALEDLFARLAAERRAAIGDMTGALDAQRSALLGDLGQAQGTLQGTLAELKDAAAVTGDAAGALTHTFEAASALTSQLRGRSSSSPEESGAEKRGLAEYHAAAAQTAEASTRVNELLRDVDDILAAPDFDEKRAALHGVMLDARQNAEGVIAYAAKWLIAVIVATIAVVTLAVALSRRMTRAHASATRGRDAAPRGADRPVVT